MAGATLIINDRDVRKLIAVMQTAGPGLFRDMSQDIRRAAQPTLNDMRNTVSGMSLPASSTTGAMAGRAGQGGITRRIAAATDVQVNAQGVRIKVDTGALGPASKLPGYMDSGQTWAHPVFGNRRAWVSQRAATPGWFSRTAAQHHPQLRTAVMRVLSEYANKMAARI